MQGKILSLVLILFVFISCSPEAKDWEKAQSENTIEAYEYFLERYPESDFAPEASSKREELYFKNVESENTISSYEGFLKSFPKGHLNEKARLRVEELYFKNAESENTISSYEVFLERFSQGGIAEKAKSRVEEFYNARNPIFRNTKTARIVIKESYHGAKAEMVALHFERDAQNFLTFAGIRVVKADSEDYDVVLEINAKGTPYGKWYGPIGTGQAEYCYTAAALEGTISFKVSSGLTYKKSFKGNIDFPKMIIFSRSTIGEGYHKYPYEAPFSDAYMKPGSFMHKLAEIVGEIYGPIILINILKYDDPAREAEQAFRKTKNSRDFGRLMDATEKRVNKEGVAEALTKITGKKYGTNVLEWIKWWEENKEKYLKK